MSFVRNRKPGHKVRARCKVAGKYYYTSRKQALTLAARAESKEGIEIYVYKCDFCHGWHLTKSLDRGGPVIAIRGSDLFDFNWKVFADTLDQQLNIFFERHGV
jgi:hypothetical protein